MKLDGILSGLSSTSGDPGAFLKQELQEAISPVTDRVGSLEKKLDTLIFTAHRIEDLLIKMRPLTDLILRLPFFK